MRSIYFIGISAISLAASSQAWAQSAPAEAAESSENEIIVTATKREQTLQDVPISVAVTDDVTVERAQIRDLIDLQSVVPSLKVAQFNAAAQTNFIIRGFGNGNGNFGIESSVGVFIDGVYRSRSLSSLDDLPEIERVEVLRGPQSTLFGKNVSAGAISIITKKPQFSWGAKAETTYGNFGAMQAKATITGPIASTLAFRLSGSLNVRDGYFQNLTTGQDLNNRNRNSLRADVLWEPTDNLSVRVIGDYNRIKERCCGVVPILNGPATQFIGRASVAGVRPIIQNPATGGLGRPIGNPANKFEYGVVLNTEPQSRIVGKGVSGQIDYDFDFAKFTSITAYRKQFNESQEDVDFTGADIASRDDRVNIKAFTQEFRLASNGDGPFSWLVGGFYQKEKLRLDQHIFYGTDIRAYADGLAGGNISTLEFLQSLVTPTTVRPGRTYFQAGQGIIIPFTLDQESYSIFGQADFEVTDRLTVTGGVAYMSDRKAATQSIVLQDPFASLNLQNVPQLPFLNVPANAFAALGGLQFFYGDTPNHGPVNFPNANESGILKGDKISYAARVAYDFDIVNAYLSYSTGWKAGAYNLSSDSRPPNANGVGRSANPENVTVLEAGLKAKFTGGFINLAVFDQKIKGFQSNAFTGISFSLVNAGKQSVKGFEVDAAYRPAPWLALTGAVTYLDPKYDSFTGAACVNFDTVRCPVNINTGRRPPFRDLSGQRPAGISEWSFSTSATLSHDFGNGFGGYLRAEYDYASDVQLTETTPPELSTFGTSLVNGSLGITNSDNQLEIMLWVRNLTNFNRLIGTFPTVAQDGSYSGYPSQPRTYGVTLRKSF